MKKPNGRIAFVHYPYSPDSARLETMPFAFNFIKLLDKAGWNVDLFLWEKPTNVYEERCTTRLSVIWNKEGFYRHAHLVGGILGVNNFLKQFFILTRKIHRRYDCVFGVGQIGIYVANIISKASRSPLIYINDEFPSQWKKSYFSEQEIISSNQAALIVVPDACRVNTLSSELETPPSKKFCVMPNYATIDSTNIDINWHRRFDIPEDYSIFINAGTIADWAQVPELLSTLPLWPEKTALLLHSRSKGLTNYKKNLSHLDYPGRLYWSETPLPEDELNSLIRYCTGTFGLYRNMGPNIEFMGRSSGKIMRSIYCRTPIIASYFSSMKFIQDNNLGILVNNPMEIPPAVTNLINRNAAYRINCDAFTKTQRDIESHWNEFCVKLHSVTNFRLIPC